MSIPWLPSHSASGSRPTTMLKTPSGRSHSATTEAAASYVWRVSSTPLENRVDVDRLARERDALNQQLDFQRATLLRKLEGLDDEQLRRPMTHSGLSLLGLVKHLTSTEHGWVGWPGGVSPPGSHGTVRDSLPSHGSSHPGSR